MIKPKPRIVMVGNIGIDTNVYLSDDRIDFSHEANFTTNLDTVGQAGGYASRAYRQLGADVAFIGYVGADWMGEHIRCILNSEDIDTAGLFIDPQGTSRSVNLVYPDGSRKNFYDGKSHIALQVPLDLCLGIMKNAKLVHINIPNWARHLLKPARDLGIPVACDIQDVVDPHDPYRLDFVRGSDYLFFSAVNHPDPSPVFKEYLELNPNLVILATLGANGCALSTTGSTAFFPPVHLDLPVVDTNGAGDAFAAGFLYSRVIEGYSLADSVHRGQICARHKCAQRSSSANMITHELLDHYDA